MRYAQYQTKFILQNPQLWLLGIGTCLVTIHLSWISKNSSSESFLIHIIFLIFVCSSIKEKYYNLNLESGAISSCLGFLLVTLVFLIHIIQLNYGGLVPFYPLISGFGLVLLASDFKGLKQYQTELLALFGLTSHTLLSIFGFGGNIALLTAKFANSVLWYTGFKVARSGLQIILPTGNITVYPPCAGMNVIVNLWSLGLLFTLVFNLNWKQKILVPMVAAIIGFVGNGVRVALMAILFAQGNKQAFEYWHEGNGSFVFAMISALIFGCFCWVLLSKNQRKNQNTMEC
ncbi:cyanoexosortase A [Tolypothrix sp. PCC 7910]|uniref:cyanoexosortase A n=1 Tax=Tolypothrix sp. PCC 7910 TaxID=2099387 RepID=UPI00142784A8|nr:cyanoexosortase A [Tolypothrix sp. PCC 7910]QIR39500.1 cyanoexosortase A [Tolypothrix sp. PCC 7910]